MSGMAISVILLLLGALIIITACIIAYNRRLDKITSGELRDTHSSIPEPGAAASGIYKIVLMVIVVISLFSISTANGRISSLQNTVSQLQSSQRDLNWEIQQLRDELEERTQTIVNSSVEIGDADFTDYTVPVDYTVVLKQYSDTTEVVLSVNGQDIPLRRESAGTFRGQFTAHLFDEYAEPQLCITEDGKTTVEYAELPQYFFWNFLPMPSYSCNFSSGIKHGKLTYEGRYMLDVDEPDKIASATVTYITNGKELKTLDITEQTKKHEYMTVEQGLALEKDLTFRTEITAKNGFRIVESSIMIYETGIDFDGMEYTRIYDPDGKLVWEDHYKE